MLKKKTFIFIRSINVTVLRNGSFIIGIVFCIAIRNQYINVKSNKYINSLVILFVCCLTSLKYANLKRVAVAINTNLMQNIIEKKVNYKFTENTCFRKYSFVTFNTL